MKTIIVALICLALVTSHPAHQKIAQSRKSRIEHLNHHINMQTSTRTSTGTAWDNGIPANLYDDYTVQDLNSNQELLTTYAERVFDVFAYNGVISEWDLYDVIVFNSGWIGRYPPNRADRDEIYGYWLGNSSSLSKEQYVQKFSEYCQQAVEYTPDLYKPNLNFYKGRSLYNVFQHEIWRREMSFKLCDAFKYEHSFGLHYSYFYEINLFISTWAKVPAKSSSEMLDLLFEYNEGSQYYSLECNQFKNWFYDFVVETYNGYFD